VAARALLEQTLAAYRRVLDDANPNTAVVLSNLASAVQELGDVSDALALYQEAARLLERSLGPEHPSTRSVQKNMLSIERGAK
jgi:tetratricopeptide (TPR) repeat protein